MPTASIIAIGSEMLGPVRVDTNSLKITALLESFAVPLVRKAIVGDSKSDLVAEIRFALQSAGVLITTGGLGPTEDDLTRDALAEALGLELERDEAIVEKLLARFAARGLEMPEVNKRQANVFPGQETLANDLGTAPGFHLELDGKHVWVFPGVPRELEWMLETYLAPWLEQRSGGRSRYRRVMKIAGLTESGVEEMLKPYYERRGGELLTILASPGSIEIHLNSDGSEAEAARQIAEREKEILEIFGERVYGYDSDTLESVVGALLSQRGETLAVAESCTGGLLGSRITDVAGSSSYFLGGAICYTGEAKIAMTDVDPELIREHGQVSEPVAHALASGIRARFGATWGVGITGIAGPGGGTPEKPVGTVHIAVAGPGVAKHRKISWPSSRALVKWYSTQQALDLLRRSLVASPN
jgi:nicotinamide-nucleotide amidase